MEYKILSVKIVQGNTLKKNWTSPMQIITTDKGKFIATMDFNWKPYVGTTVIATTKASAGYNWLIFKSSPEVAAPIKTVTKKAELPANYDINDTPELKRVYDYIKQGEPITFLTGGAGTGKSTFINYLKNNLHEETGKNCVVLAPTGIAAINIDGETIHHFFRFPLDPFENKDIKKSQKNPILDYTDLIIIDEVSMVASWMIDHIDYALRLWCDNTKAFGGKQLLLIGDCFQLPPIINDKEPEMKKFAEKWRSPFFFDAKSLDNVDIKCVSLRKIYRQQEDTFMHMLNRIRTCKTGYEKDIAFLNEKCLIESRLGTKNVPQECLLLSTKKYKVANFNLSELNKLKKTGATPKTFEAEITGIFDKVQVLTPATLELCIGAKIMVTKNVNTLGLVNGDRGTVIGFGGSGKDDTDYVDINIRNHVYRIKRETWQSFEYKWDENTKTIQQKEVGTFTQIPLTNGWAITIHKSQGLTLDAVAIDAPDAWESGQVYVALSRAKTLNGIFLCQKIPLSAIKSNEYVKDFYEQNLLATTAEDLSKPENDHSEVKISNDGFTVNTAAQIDSVTIDGIDFRLYPKEGEKIGVHAKETISKLIFRNLIPEHEMDKLLHDENYCFSTFGIHFQFHSPTWTLKLPLLVKDRDKNPNKARYWAKNYCGYYICSQWYQNCAAKLAQWLIHLSEEHLEDAKRPVSKNEVQRSVEMDAIGCKIVKRTSVIQNGHLTFKSEDGSLILADENGMGNAALPWTGKKIRIKIFEQDGETITKWMWEDISTDSYPADSPTARVPDRPDAQHGKHDLQ